MIKPVCLVVLLSVGPLQGIMVSVSLSIYLLCQIEAVKRLLCCGDP